MNDIVPDENAIRSRAGRRDRFPSRSMLPPDGKRYRCRWIEDGLTVHSDGNVTCGLDDPFAERSFGNNRLQTVEMIGRNPEYGRMVTALAEGRRCRHCQLFEEIGENEPEPTRLSAPKTLVVEPTILCNLRCPQQACIPNNESSPKTRGSLSLATDVFGSLIAQVSSSIEYIYFFNYGDPFMHRSAEDMLREISRQVPHAKVTTSTNAIMLRKKDRAAAVVAAGLDHVTCTISGMNQESYARYHINGNLGHALQGMTNLAEEKRNQGATRPEIVWRYLLFRWTDDEEQVQAAISLAREIGVTLRLYLTMEPKEAASYRFAPGSPMYDKYRDLIDGAHGYASPLPDNDGFYGLEEMETFGSGRWTSPRARLPFTANNRWIRFSLATNRPDRASADTSVRVMTPWGADTVRVRAGRWHDVTLRIPGTHRNRGGSIYLVTSDYWFPADELDSPDLRCLGVIVGEPQKRLGLMEGVRARLRSARATRPSDEKTRVDGADWRASIPLAPSRQARYVAFRDD